MLERFKHLLNCFKTATCSVAQQLMWFLVMYWDHVMWTRCAISGSTVWVERVNVEFLHFVWKDGSLLSFVLWCQRRADCIYTSSWWLICDKWQKSDELMWALCVRVHTHTSVDCVCWCQGGDQETREIRGTIKFLKGFWEEMSSSSVLGRWSGRQDGDRLKPDWIKACDACETPQWTVDGDEWCEVWANTKTEILL